ANATAERWRQSAALAARRSARRAEPPHLLALRPLSRRPRWRLEAASQRNAGPRLALQSGARSNGATRSFGTRAGTRRSHARDDRSADRKFRAASLACSDRRPGADRRAAERTLDRGPGIHLLVQQMALSLLVPAVIAVLIAQLWLIGAREPVYALAKG